MKRIGAILFWVGLVIAIAGITATAIFGVRAGQSLADSLDEAAPMSGGSTTVTMAENEQRTILGTNSQEAEAAECTVVGPSEEGIPVSPASEFLEVDDTPVTAVGTFESTTAGEYRVECIGGLTSISPALDIDTVGSGVIGVVGGVLGVGLGGLLLVIGAVLWFIGRSKAKKAAQGGSFGSGGYNQGAYASPPPPPGSTQQPPSTNPYRPGSGSTPPPPPPANY